MTATVESGPAIFSECRRWRYTLTRSWLPESRLVNFVMLNPSTADEKTLDPTLRRCARYALDWGYSGFVVTNLFAWRATDPKAMKRAALEGEDVIGPKNDEWLSWIARHVETVVCGWGAHGKFQGRDEQVVAALRYEGIQLHWLRLNGDGAPAHPLYLPKTLTPQRWAA